MNVAPSPSGMDRQMTIKKSDTVMPSPVESTYSVSVSSVNVIKIPPIKSAQSVRAGYMLIILYHTILVL